MLLCEVPSWLFQVKAGGTTIWERWDAEDGTMVWAPKTEPGVVPSAITYGQWAIFCTASIGSETIQPGLNPLR